MLRVLGLGLPLAPAVLLLFLAGCGSDEEQPASSLRTTTATPRPTTSVAGTPATSSQPASTCQPPAGAAPEPQMKTYQQAPAMTIDPAKKYTATVKTVRGDFTIMLRPDLAPKHVNSFVFLARDHYFDG